MSLEPRLLVLNVEDIMPAEMADRQSIVITDLSCRFPGKGDDLAGFWQSICSGKCMSSPFKICSLRKVGDALPYRRGPRSLMSDSEDGGTLGYLFQAVEDAKARLGRLRMFQQARLARAAMVQILFSVKAGKEKANEDQLLQYLMLWKLVSREVN